MITFLALALMTSTEKIPISSLVHVSPTQVYATQHTDAEWKKLLPTNSYKILRQSDTEKPYSGKYWDFHKKGYFHCAGCGLTLFSTSTKFDSGTGWPSFYQEIARGRTLVRTDTSDGMTRDEILCSRCGGHLGHVFDDGPEPTGLRYCMNSPALVFSTKS